MNLHWEHIQHLGALWAAVLILYAAGSVLGRFIPGRRSRYEDLFLRMVLGLLAAVVPYSLILSRGETVHLLFIPAGILLLRQINKGGITRSGLKVFGPSAPGDVMLLVAAATLLFVYEGVTMLRFDEFPFFIPEPDYIYYSARSGALGLTHQENRSLMGNLLFPEFYSGMEPYHYFELWLNSLMSTAFGLPLASSLMLVTFPLLYLGIFAGILALWESAGRTGWMAFGGSLLLIAVSGFVLEIYDRAILTEDYGMIAGSTPLSLHGKKYAPMMIFGLAAWIIWRKRGFRAGAIALLALPAVIFGVFPALAGGMILYSLLGLIRKHHPPGVLWRIIGTYIAFSFLFFGLYFFFGTAAGGPEMSDALLLKLLNSGWSGYEAKTVFFKMAFPLFRLAVCYLPFIILLAVGFKWRRNGESRPSEFDGQARFLLLVLLAGLVSSALLHPLTDASQLFHNSYPLINIFLISGFVLITGKAASDSRIRGRTRLVAIALSLLCLRNLVYHIHSNREAAEMADQYSPSFMEAVNALSAQAGEQYPGAWLLAAPKLRGGIIYRMQPGGFLYLKPGFKDLICLNVVDPLTDSPQAKISGNYQYETPEFTYYVRNLKGENKFISEDSARISFMKAYGIRFLMARRDADTGFLEKFVKVRIRDEKSGELAFLLEWGD